MKFQVLSSLLTSHLTALSRVLGSKSPMPILDDFLFEITPDKLIVTASDGDTTMITNIEITEVEGTGRFAIPAKTLLEPLNAMPQQTLTFVIDPGNLDNFIAQNADEYPKLKELDPAAHTFTISATALQNGINSTSFAVANDEMRPMMNGICFDIKHDSCTFVASNSKILVRLINKSVTADFEESFIMCKKPATLLKSIISKGMEDAEITFDDKSVRVKIGGYTISSSRIEGKFPRYEAVIPKNNTNIMTIDRLECINTTRRISVFASAATNQVKFEIDKDQLIVSAQDVDYSLNGNEKISCSYDSVPLQIGFRANYLIEMLNTMTSSEVEFQMSDSFRACLIVPVENNENEDLLMLIMPMQLADFGN